MELKDKGNVANFIAKYTRNLNQDAIKNKIDPIISRENEIRRLIQILSRKTKNNPVLVGEPGVGKTAIVEGLVQSIIRREVPDNLANKVILELDMSSVVAGAKFQGQFEERLKKIIEAIKKEKDKYIVFIDELHIITGAGKAQGSIDAANILKPALARGDIRAIGATTIKEYKTYIEKDAALERRFQKVMVLEPSIEETIVILRGIKERYEAFHGVDITDAALISSAVLSERYITDRFLPDKAIDILDEACAYVKMSTYTTPEDLEKLEKKLANLHIEKMTLAKEKTDIAKKRIIGINIESEELKKKIKVLEKEWLGQREIIDSIRRLRKDIQAETTRADLYQGRGEYEKAAQIKYVSIKNKEKALKKMEEKLKQNSKGNKEQYVKVNVTEVEIAKIVSLASGIPIERLTKTEKEKVLSLRDTLEKRVKGQGEALDLVTDAIIRSRANIKDPNRPIGSFLFLGPTGVGKTEVAKTLAQALFGTEKSFIRLDMSEFMERHSVAKIIGSPPGYVGYDDSGHLTEIVRNKPHSIVLFDELEKAHPDVFNILLQILDEGTITDSKGKDIDFKNTIIIMTSNIGSELILANDKNFKHKVMQAVKQFFRPEFLNRIDEIVVFNSLDEKRMMLIIDKFLTELAEKLQQQNITLQFDKSIKKDIYKNGSNPIYGARPLKRYIQKNIESVLAYWIIEGKMQPNRIYRIKRSLTNYTFEEILTN